MTVDEWDSSPRRAIVHLAVVDVFSFSYPNCQGFFEQLQFYLKNAIISSSELIRVRVTLVNCNLKTKIVHILVVPLYKTRLGMGTWDDWGKSSRGCNMQGKEC